MGNNRFTKDRLTNKNIFYKKKLKLKIKKKEIEEPTRYLHSYTDSASCLIKQMKLPSIGHRNLETITPVYTPAKESITKGLNVSLPNCEYFDTNHRNKKRLSNSMVINVEMSQEDESEKFNPDYSYVPT
mmetsp:Transcript_24715/g.21951  ORF Transcript_24715/g.21951 Transcript_24715/m.21951 type:complete len:129 (+) Transcript_24715:654-1040(+)